MHRSETDLDTVAPELVSTSDKFLIYSYEQAIRHITQYRSEKEQVLYMITDEVLFNVWDALCLSINQDHREVYFPYLPHVFDLLTKTENGSDLCDYLAFIEETKMDGEKGDPLGKRRAWRVVDILMKYRDTLFTQPDNT